MVVRIGGRIDQDDFDYSTWAGLVYDSKAGAAARFMNEHKRLLTNCRVAAPARLHLGFLDLHGGLGRRFGGLGVSLAEPSTELRLSPAAALDVVGCARAKVARLVARFDRCYGVSTRARVEIARIIPEHRGLGSGTQLALAVGHALNRLHRSGWCSRALASGLGRGRRSGVGIAAFDQGGVVVDGGRGGDDAPPPMIARLPFPEQWRILLIFDDGEEAGLHGAEEESAFSELPDFSVQCAGYLSRLLTMKLLPAVAEADYRSFAAAVGEFQDAIGGYFSTVQGGGCRSRRIGKILEYLRDNDIQGSGQSSWGPTAFAVTRDEAAARDLKTMIERRIGDDAFFAAARVNVLITAGNNHGGDVQAEYDES